MYSNVLKEYLSQSYCQDGKKNTHGKAGEGESMEQNVFFCLFFRSSQGNTGSALYMPACFYHGVSESSARSCLPSQEQRQPLHDKIRHGEQRSFSCRNDQQQLERSIFLQHFSPISCPFNPPHGCNKAVGCIISTCPKRTRAAEQGHQRISCKITRVLPILTYVPQRN